MDLDGSFSSPNLGGDLFVEETGNHQRQQFSLTRGQRFKAFSQRCNFRLLLTCGTVAFQGDLNRIQQILIAEWFRQELDGPRFHCPHRHRDIAVGGDKYDWNANISCGQLALEIKPADARQSDIEDEAANNILMPAVHEFSGRPKQFYVQTHRLYQAFDRTTNRGIIVNHENDGSLISHEASLK